MGVLCFLYARKTPPAANRLTRVVAIRVSGTTNSCNPIFIVFEVCDSQSS